MEDPGFHTHLSAAPVFPAWVPGSDWLLCHHGATLSAFETGTGQQRILSASASGFRTPAVSADGTRIAWAEVSSGSVVIFVGSITGEPEVSARFGGGVVLSFRPGSHELIAAVASSPDSGVFGEIVRIPGGDEPPARIVHGPIVAYWWSPNGEKLATLHPTYSGDGRFQVRLYDLRGVFLGAMEPLIPSADSATMVGFFDQYTVSHPWWSADSRWFAICGRPVSEGLHPSFSGGTPDSAYVWDTESRVAPVRLGDAGLAVFQRPQVNGG
jgi:Tol biopolymer transport system component